jgi:hypothetical protein
MDPAASKRQEALGIADELLADIELSRIGPADAARKAFRLARLVDDTDAMAWLRFEIGGYPTGATLPPDAWAAAGRSNRQFVDATGRSVANPVGLGALQANVQAGLAQLAAAQDASVSITSANPSQFVSAPKSSNNTERSAIRNFVGDQQAVLDKVLGAIHEYATDRYQELRFGAAAETAFDVVRADVDARIARLVPDAPGMLAAAFENAASTNPEHWASAAASCRRLLKVAADALRPPGPDVDGRKMTDAAYINRLVDWIAAQSKSETVKDVVVTDLEYLGRRLDATDDAGQKGAHASVTRLEAARFLLGSYQLLGDILALAAEPDEGASVSSGATTDSAAPTGAPRVSAGE